MEQKAKETDNIELRSEILYTKYTINFFIYQQDICTKHTNKLTLPGTAKAIARDYNEIIKLIRGVSNSKINTDSPIHLCRILIKYRII